MNHNCILGFDEIFLDGSFVGDINDSNASISIEEIDNFINDFITKNETT